MGKKYLSISMTNNIGIETMRLRFERKQVMLKKASNYSAISFMAYLCAIIVPLFVGVAIDIILDNDDVLVNVCTLTFLGFGMLGIVTMALSFIYTEKAYERN